MKENGRLFEKMARSLNLDRVQFINEKKEELINSLVELEAFEEVWTKYFVLRKVFGSNFIASFEKLISVNSSIIVN